ncbi:spore germination protein [Pleurocapsa sp. CCALA 161]|uniref:GerMN domain-containing protein n=1 Tax=Pleurocapsa sp. CCALA 161 TaxID=2107688 RepID=UPI000D070276|nr:GerMN domain-containing protein [Pleurocapsa sp. CCALA 161]PSB06841.1 spore germination protein [Pleurocapsa sp. CCALA 161]
MNVRSKSPNSKLILKRFLLVGIAGITAVWAFRRAREPTVNQSSSSVELQPAKFSPQFYWLEIVGDRVKLTPKTISATATSPEDALKEAFNKLLKQSPNLELTTTIPQQTQLLDLHITDNDIYIDLSQEFTQGGGSSSMIYRVAQVLYTATSINPQASVFLSIKGQPLNEVYPLGGEGLLLEYPLTRQKFTRDFLFDLNSYLQPFSVE